MSDRVAEWLARRRVSFGFLTAVIVLWLADPTAATIARGVAIAAPGEALRFWAAGHLNKSREVTASGPYRWLAHPLYVGSSLMGAGVAVASGSVLAALLIALYLVTTLGAAIKTEEALLRRTFGAEYDNYKRAAPMSAVDRERRFSVARALANREYRTAAGFALALLLLVLKATYNGAFWRAPAGR